MGWRRTLAEIAIRVALSVLGKKYKPVDEIGKIVDDVTKKKQT